MSTQNSNPAVPATPYQLRKTALDNSVERTPDSIKAAIKILRDFVLSSESGKLVWQSAAVAHAAAGITREDFEHSLRNQAGTSASNWILDKSHKFTEDPYRQLSLLDWFKYLYYGGSRTKTGAGTGNYETDQDTVMHYFGIETVYEITEGQRYLKCDYSKKLYPAIKLRNTLCGHTHDLREEETSLSTLMGYYADLTGCLKPLLITSWACQKDCREMMETLEKKFFQALGVLGYQITDIMAMIRIAPAQLPRLEKLLTEAGLRIEDGSVNIYGEIWEFTSALSNAWRYYRLSEASGVEQLKDWVYRNSPQSNQVSVKEKPATVLKEGGAEEWTELADRYRLGIKGLGQSNEQAKYWYTQAATATPPSLQAMYELGRMIWETEPMAAWGYFRSAASLGHSGAMVEMGYHTERGTCGQPKDLSQALAYYKQAAQQNDRDALWMVGRCYNWGMGVDVDLKLALSYYLQAHLMGNEEATIFLLRTAFELIMSYCDSNYNGWDFDIGEGMQYLEIAAKYGGGEEAEMLADLYYYGQGHICNENSDYESITVFSCGGRTYPEKAIPWYRVAAQRDKEVAARIQKKIKL